MDWQMSVTWLMTSEVWPVWQGGAWSQWSQWSPPGDSLIVMGKDVHFLSDTVTSNKLLSSTHITWQIKTFRPISCLYLEKGTNFYIIIFYMLMHTWLSSILLFLLPFSTRYLLCDQLVVSNFGSLVLLPGLISDCSTAHPFALFKSISKD